MHRTLRVCFVVCFVLFRLFVRVGVCVPSAPAIPHRLPPPRGVYLTYTLDRICLTNPDQPSAMIRLDKYRTALRQLRLSSQSPQPPTPGSSTVASARVHHHFCRSQRSSWMWSPVSLQAVQMLPPSSPPSLRASSRLPGKPTFSCSSPTLCPPSQLSRRRLPPPSLARTAISRTFNPASRPYPSPPYLPASPRLHRSSQQSRVRRAARLLSSQPTRCQMPSRLLPAMP